MFNVCLTAFAISFLPYLCSIFAVSDVYPCMKRECTNKTCMEVFRVTLVKYTFVIEVPTGISDCCVNHYNAVHVANV